jgi:hypothetical protein
MIIYWTIVSEYMRTSCLSYLSWLALEHLERYMNSQSNNETKAIGLCLSNDIVYGSYPLGVVSQQWGETTLPKFSRPLEPVLSVATPLSQS